MEGETVVDGPSVGTELKHATLAIISTDEVHVRRVALIKVQEARRLLVLPGRCLRGSLDLVEVAPDNRVSTRVRTRCGLSIYLDYPRLVVRNERDVVIALRTRFNLMIDGAVRVNCGPVTSRQVLIVVEVKRLDHGTCQDLLLDDRNVAVDLAKQHKPIFAVQVAARHRAHGVRDIVEETAPFPVALVVDGRAEAM